MGPSVAVVGCGVMGRHHIRVCNELRVLSTICDSQQDRVLKLMEQYEEIDAPPLYTDYRDLASVPWLDAVVVATPTPSHFEIAKEFLCNGVHVLLEKPMTLDLTDAAELIEVARENNAVLGIGYIEVFNPAFSEVRQLVLEGKLGEITSVNIKRIGGIPRSADNVILDLMTHDFGLLIGLFESTPDEIHACQGKVRDGIVNSAQVLLQFGSATATCEANWVSPTKIRKMAVTGTRGYCEADLIHKTVTFYTDSSTYYVEHFSGEPLRCELEAFLHAAESGNMEDIVSGYDGLKILDTTLRAVSIARGN